MNILDQRRTRLVLTSRHSSGAQHHARCRVRSTADTRRAAPRLSRSDWDDARGRSSSPQRRATRSSRAWRAVLLRTLSSLLLNLENELLDNMRLRIASKLSAGMRGCTSSASSSGSRAAFSTVGPTHRRFALTSCRAETRHRASYNIPPRARTIHRLVSREIRSRLGGEL